MTLSGLRMPEAHLKALSIVYETGRGIVSVCVSFYSQATKVLTEVSGEFIGMREPLRIIFIRMNLTGSLSSSLYFTREF